MKIPTVAGVDQIAGVADPVVRNLQITQCYHELSLALAGLTGSGANWCTFATWASKQAGQSIRNEDLQRTFERLFRRSPAVLAAVDALLPQARRLGVQWRKPALVETLLEALDPASAVARASDAVARGNRKVFEEIAREFARFLAEFRDDTAFDAAKAERFCAALRDGEPPEGQRRLREAFTAYCRARFETDPRARAEWMLLANLVVGYHEQIRLQPEILEAMNAALGDVDAVKQRLLAALVPGFWLRLRVRVARLLGRELPLDRALGRLAGLAHEQLRQVVTRSLMSLQLSSGEVLRLGRDLRADFPPTLRQLTLPALLELLARVDRTADSLTGTGARDWANFEQRIHFIADLFRAYHERPQLLDPPFSPEQVAELAAGRRPAGRL